MKHKPGLENVIALESSISSINGKDLRYRGYSIHDLADNASYEEVVCLLLDGNLPKRSRLSSVKKKLKRHRKIPKQLKDLIKDAPSCADPMTVLQTAISYMRLTDDKCPTLNEDPKEVALRIIAIMPSLVAALGRKSDKKSIKNPDLKLDHASNFLYMITGKKPTKQQARMMDKWFILHADHTLNASTFTARVITSTLSDLHSGITGAIGALKGPLHGGANQKVMQMLREIKNPENVEPYMEKKFKNKEKVMGIGHRVYKKGDPRADHLDKMAEKACRESGEPQWHEISKKIESIVYKKIKLKPNVDFFSASYLYASGIPIDVFPCLFAASRSAGWSAHIIEQHDNNRLIRPRIRYVGPKNRKFKPISRR